MSTSYRVTGRGTRCTLAWWKRLAARHGLEVGRSFSGTTVMVGDLHLDRSIEELKAGRACNYFTRCGGGDPGPVLEAIEAEGKCWLSEHDEGF